MYIALEGVKGVGKSTVLSHLRGWLELAGVDYQMLCPTRPMPSDVWWERAYPYHQHDDDFRQALYAARSNYHASRVDFDRGLVLGDRSIITSLVTRWEQTQHMSAEDYVKHVRQMEYQIALPDHVLLLDAPDSVLLPRLAARHRSYGQYDEQVERLQAARSAYHQIEHQAEQLGLERIRWHHVHSARHLPELVQCIGQHIVSLLPSRRRNSAAAVSMS